MLGQQLRDIDVSEYLNEVDYGSVDEAISPIRPRTRMAGGFVMAARPFLTRMSKTHGCHDWQVVALYAMGNSGTDGHCRLADGEIQSEVLGKPTMTNRKAQTVIKTAVERGWLGHGSNRRCLVLPSDVRYKQSNSGRSCPLH